MRTPWALSAGGKESEHSGSSSTPAGLSWLLPPRLLPPSAPPLATAALWTLWYMRHCSGIVMSQCKVTHRRFQHLLRAPVLYKKPSRYAAGASASAAVDSGGGAAAAAVKVAPLAWWASMLMAMQWIHSCASETALQRKVKVAP